MAHGPAGEKRRYPSKKKAPGGKNFPQETPRGEGLYLLKQERLCGGRRKHSLSIRKRWVIRPEGRVSGAEKAQKI